MRRCSLFLVLAGALAASAQQPVLPSASTGEDPTVTFYPGGDLLSPLRSFYDHKHDPFHGFLYDGDERLTEITWPFFVTLRMKPGVHTFSATTNKKHPDPNTQGTLLLESGKHYFLEVFGVQARNVYVPVIVPPVGALVPVPVVPAKASFVQRSCLETEKDLAKFHRQLEDKHVSKTLQSSIVNSYPACPTPPSPATNMQSP